MLHPVAEPQYLVVESEGLNGTDALTFLRKTMSDCR